MNLCYLLNISLAQIHLSCVLRVCIYHIQELLHSPRSKTSTPFLEEEEKEVYVMVLAGCTLAGPTFLLNYITQLLWWPHKLLLSNYSPYLGSCKWQPPRSPFASTSYGLVPVFRVPCHACTWRDSIKGLVHLALGSLFG